MSTCSQAMRSITFCPLFYALAVNWRSSYWRTYTTWYSSYAYYVINIKLDQVVLVTAYHTTQYHENIRSFFRFFFLKIFLLSLLLCWVDFDLSKDISTLLTFAWMSALCQRWCHCFGAVTHFKSHFKFIGGFAVAHNISAEQPLRYTKYPYD